MNRVDVKMRCFMFFDPESLKPDQVLEPIIAYWMIWQSAEKFILMSIVELVKVEFFFFNASV